MHELLRKAGIIGIPSQVGSGAGKKIPSSDVRKVLTLRGFEFPRIAQIISFMMCKGGVGKSTSVFFLGQRIAAYGFKVLLVDADPQGNLTSAFGLDVDEDTPVLADILEGGCTTNNAIIHLSDFISLIPSTPMNANVESRIREKFKNPSLPFKRTVDPLRSDYDFILVDCAPALNLTNAAIVSGSDLIIMPVNPDKFSKIGLNQTLGEIKTIGEDFKVSPNVRIVFTRFDAREYTSLKYLSEVAEEHKDLMFQTTIRTASDLKNAISKKEDLFSLGKSNAKEDYDSLAQEILGIQSVAKKVIKKNNN
jgi:chromosome partitioning protein